MNISLNDEFNSKLKLADSHTTTDSFSEFGKSNKSIHYELKNETLSSQIDKSNELEIKIHSWLDEIGVHMSDPQDK